jgi:hypothetical protein
MNAQAEEISQAARTGAQTIPGTEKTAAQHIADMERIAQAVGTSAILRNAGLLKPTAREQWNALPEKSRAILASYEAAGGGKFVPDAKENSHE